jgi:uncharacterized damage-inducible protein DinB
MQPPLDRTFLDCSTRRLTQLASRVQDCLARLSPEQIWARGGENENAVGNLVLHLCGNVRQWIVSGVGGAADRRDRDTEFAARGNAPAGELAARLDAAIRDATAVVSSASAARLGERIQIQGYDVTVLEAVYHVVEHFAGHTGQIIFATKMLTGEDLGYYSHLSRGEHRQTTP